MTRQEAVEWLKSIKSLVDKYDDVVALREAVKALEQAPCEDAISRQAAVYIASGFCHPANIADELAKLPSVNPQPKTGHWIDINYHHYYDDGDIETTELRCSCCNEVVEWDIELLHKPYYCENCGAKMVEPQERSDKG